MTIINFEKEQLQHLNNLQLTAEQEQFLSKTVIDAIHGSFFMLDTDARLVRWNTYLRDDFLGKSESEMAGTDLVQYFHPDDRQFIIRKIENILSHGAEELFEARVLVQGGPAICLRLITGRRVMIDGNYFLVGMGMDITDRQLLEEELNRLTRALQATNSCNQALIHTDDEMELIQKICNIIVETGGYRMAWVGYAEQDTTKRIRPVAQAGFEQSYLEHAIISWADDQYGWGPVGTAVRTGKPCSTLNIQEDPQFEPWRIEAIRRGYASLRSLPLKNGDKVFGALTIYSEIAHAFNAKEAALLSSLADNLAYGITMLRSRVAQEEAENLLKQSEERFRKLFERHSAIKILVDPDTGNIIDANHAAAEFYGWSIEELRQMSLQQINSISPQLINSNLKKSRLSEQNRFSFRHSRADGSIRDVEVFSNTIELEDKEFLYVIIHDITERKRYESLIAFRIRLLEIAENNSMEQMLNITLDEAEKMTESSVGFFHFVADDQRTISMQTWSSRSIKGVDKGDAIGVHLQVQEDEIWSDVIMGRRSVIDNDESQPHYHRVISDGYREVKRTLVVPVIRGNKVLAIVGVGNKSGSYDGDDLIQLESLADTAWDIVARKRSELSEQDAREALIQSQKMELIGQLAGGIAHDFNNMLGVIIGNVEIAMDRHAIEEPLLRNLKDILNATERSADLMRQLLAFARKLPVMPIVLDLNTMIEKMLTILRRLIGENIAIAWIPDSHALFVQVDPSQIDQILINLCVNARDAIDGIGNITIKTGIVSVDQTDSITSSPCSRPGEYVTLSVTDDGCGIKKEYFLHIFEPFFTTKGHGKGTGLGLSTVYGIVKQNNGCIDFQSEQNKGSTFTIYLPRHKGYSGPDESEQPEPSIKYGKETILLVEDEPDILHLCERMLVQYGYKVLSASKPIEAIQISEKYSGSIDLLLTDVVMPGMNGSDLSNRLQLTRPSLKTLFMSGYTADVFLSCQELHAGVHFIQKPFFFKSLISSVYSILNQVEH